MADRRKLIKHLLSKCTKEENDVFNRMYGSVNSMLDSQLDWAIKQCERTVKINSPEYKLEKEFDEYVQQQDEI